MSERAKSFLKWSFWIISVILMFMFVSYAVSTFNGQGEKQHTITTGTLVLTLDDATSEGILISPAIPITEEKGLQTTAYEFKLKNTGTLNANYQLSLVEDEEKYSEHGCTGNRIPLENIRYSLTKNGEPNPATSSLMNTSPLILDTGSIAAKSEEITYTLRIWLDYNAGNNVMGHHFHGKLKLQALQEGHSDYSE